MGDEEMTMQIDIEEAIPARLSVSGVLADPPDSGSRRHLFDKTGEQASDNTPARACCQYPDGAVSTELWHEALDMELVLHVFNTGHTADPAGYWRYKTANPAHPGGDRSWSSRHPPSQIAAHFGCREPDICRPVCERRSAVQLERPYFS